MSELPALLFFYMSHLPCRSSFEIALKLLHSSSLQLEAGKIYTAGSLGFFIVAKKLFEKMEPQAEANG
jgi:hypothetical protein